MCGGGCLLFIVHLVALTKFVCLEVYIFKLDVEKLVGENGIMNIARYTV